MTPNYSDLKLPISINAYYLTHTWFDIITLNISIQNEAETHNMKAWFYVISMSVDMLSIPHQQTPPPKSLILFSNISILCSPDVYCYINMMHYDSLQIRKHFLSSNSRNL